jgi:hypothetical protein
VRDEDTARNLVTLAQRPGVTEFDGISVPAGRDRSTATSPATAPASALVLQALDVGVQVLNVVAELVAMRFMGLAVMGYVVKGSVLRLQDPA